MTTSDSNLTRSFMYLFEMLMQDICQDEAAAKDKNMKSWIVCVFLFSVIWSICATGDKSSQDKFDAFFRDLSGGKKDEIPQAVGKIECPLPPEGTIYDYMFEVLHEYILYHIMLPFVLRLKDVVNGLHGLISLKIKLLIHTLRSYLISLYQRWILQGLNFVHLIVSNIIHSTIHLQVYLFDGSDGPAQSSSSICWTNWYR